MIEQASRPVVDDPGAVMKGPEISSPHSGMRPRTRGPARWRGLKTAHCAACGETFTTVAAFDKHRAGSHTLDRDCLDPATVGLVDVGGAYPCWGSPGRAEDGAESVRGARLAGRAGDDNGSRWCPVMTNHRPNIEQLARDALDDLGFVDDDRTVTDDRDLFHAEAVMGS